MKNLSLKTKLNFWYIFVIALILISTLVFLSISMGGFTNITLKQTLQEEINECVEDINDEGFEEIYDDDFEFYKDGVEIAIYQNGDLFRGNVPSDIDLKHLSYSDGFNEYKGNSNNWYVYDKMTNIDEVFIRGYMSISTIETFNTFIIKIFIIIIPILLIISALVGYFITKRTLSPIDKIVDTAINISNGNDLSRRINLNDDSKNEINLMAKTFDEMFERLETSFENEKKFTSDASHELRTPVSVILASCDYALYEGSEKEQKEALNLIKEQGEKLSSLISQLLMFTRFDFNRIKIQKEKINLKELVESVCEEMEIKAKEKNIVLNSKINENINICSDTVLLMRVFINLISNAIKYGKDNGYVNITSYKENDHVVCIVEDNGIGINSENINKIWNRFYQVNPSRDNENSLGLGLSMVKTIIEKLDGSISVSSKENVGTKFKIILKN
ncbi:HAMP domain-containing sensor histidine kinase [Anaerofustis sp.]|uniref:sensor histidine kinase n=1 Tax=Anaerofustis sp. TaxID=1872517 RepID=UPI0025C5801B|nr:HAMP domain-containing sensor histidine kinase [Anaerofustis sp.]